MTSAFIRKGNLDTETQAHRREGHVKTEAKIRVIHLQVKEK